MRGVGVAILGGLLLLVLLLGSAVTGGETSSQPSASLPASAVSAAAPAIRDEDFAKALGGQVTSVSPAVAQGMGRRVCSALDDGIPADDVRSVLAQKGVTPAEASRIVLAAVTMYCAENKAKAMP